MKKKKISSFHTGLTTSKGPLFFRNVDLPLLFSVTALVIFGLIMVYDSSIVQAYQDYGDKYFYIKQQLIWVALGTFALWFFSWFDYHFLKKLSLPFLIIGVLLLLGVFIPGLGISGGGAHRWLSLGFFSIQPAEIIKLVTIIFFASIFEKKPKTIPFAIVVILISAIIGIFQEDLGSTIVFFLTSITMYILAGANLRYFLYLIPTSLVGFVLFVLTSTYRRERILAYLDPFSDPQGYSYHIYQVLLALGSGGLTGLGIGESRQKFEYIPEVTTDSIFAIVGEELGFVGCVVLISLLSIVIYRGFKIASDAPDNFGRLLASGLTIWLGIQALVNLGAMVSIIPLTGVPLPFISYGGSALLVNLVAVGILLNISKNAED